MASKPKGVTMSSGSSRRLSQNDIVISLEMLRELAVCQPDTAEHTPALTSVHTVDIHYTGVDTEKTLRPANSLSRRLLDYSSSARRARQRTVPHRDVSQVKTCRRRAAGCHPPTPREMQRIHTHQMRPYDPGSTCTPRDSKTASGDSSRKLADDTHMGPNGWWTPRVLSRESTSSRRSQKPHLPAISGKLTSPARTSRPTSAGQGQGTGTANETLSRLQPQVMSIRRRPGMNVHSHQPRETYTPDPVLPRLRPGSSKGQTSDRTSTRYVHTWLNAGYHQPHITGKDDTKHRSPSREYGTNNPCVK